MKTIATHKKPDVDALVATWLVERYLFDGIESHVVFVDRSFKIGDENLYDCVVDVGQVHSVHRLVFDHKPPAFANRHITCAAKLVRDHLLALGHSVQHLADLMQLVHDGDSIKLRGGSVAYRQSRARGLHGAVKRWQEQNLTDGELYKRTRAWLDRRFRRSVRAKRTGKLVSGRAKKKGIDSEMRSRINSPDVREKRSSSRQGR